MCEVLILISDFGKTGAGTTMSRLGMPDLGIATLNDMRENAAMIAGLDRTVPLVADADTGFGGRCILPQYWQRCIQALLLPKENNLS